MQFNKNKCEVLHFGTSNDQSSNETGTDWFYAVLHTSFQAYERPSAYTLRGRNHSKTTQASLTCWNT